MGGSNSSSLLHEGDPAPESVKKTSKRKEEQVTKEDEEELVPDVQQQQLQMHRDQQNDYFMTDTNSLDSAASSTVSIPDLADGNTPEVFIDTEKGKPLFTKNSPPSSVASERLTNGKVDTRIDVIEQQGWQYTKENDLDQISVTNEDYL